jgi:hypothetical protein
MAEETKVKLDYSKVAKKGWLYKNERKREGSNDPDFKGKIVELDISLLKDAADDEGKVSLFLSGWTEEDQQGTARVGLAVQKGVPAASAGSESPF